MNIFSQGEKVTAQAVNENFSNQNSRLSFLVDLYSPHYLPAGLISVWAGTQASIPSGWFLCDGNNGTPDLRNKFIVGAGSDYNIGDEGGASSVQLTVNQMPSHNHAQGTLVIGNSSTHTHSYFRRSGYAGQGADRQRGTAWTNDSGANTGSAGAHTHNFSGSTANTGGGQAHENRPPYYALCFIMLGGPND